jgi:cobalt/nickel transport system permease protein
VRHDFLDRYSRLDSPVHRLPTWLKSLLLLVLVTALAATPRGLMARVGAASAVFLLLVLLLSRIPVSFVAVRLAVLEPLAAGVAVLALLQPGGLAVFTFLLARSTLCLLALILFTNTAPFDEVLRLLRRLHVPALLVTVLALMYRYVFLVIDEVERLERARRSRTFVAGRARAWRGAAGTAGQLFVRSSERAERVYAAMCARGWRP